MSTATRTAPFDVFLSYHWRDHGHVEAVARKLRDHSVAPFLDRWYLVPGQPWPRALEQTLNTCRAVAVFVGPGEMGPWQQREKYVALERQDRDKGFPVIPVLLPGCDPALGFLSHNAWIDLRHGIDDPEEIAALAKAIRGEPRGPELEGRRMPSVCPYRGLRYFREEDQAFFFGRETDSDRVAEAVRRQTLTFVVGGSGSGKSSLVRAGVIPRLRRDRKAWDIVTMIPTDRPLMELAKALVGGLEPPEMTENSRLDEAEKIVASLSQSPSRLRDLSARILEKQPGTERLLIVVDQWEELYTVSALDQREKFLAQVLEATAGGGRLHVAATLRGDFVDKALEDRSLADRMQGAQELLGPMTREELRRAIEGPAERCGLRFEEGLAERIVDDAAGQPGHLPLLEFVLEQLWIDPDAMKGPEGAGARNRSQQRMTHAAYQDLEGVQGVLKHRAEAVFSQFNDAEQKICRMIFLRLIQVLEDNRPVARRVTLSGLLTAKRDRSVVEPVVRALAGEKARLLTTERSVRPDEEKGIKIAHESLIGRWPRLDQWLKEDPEYHLWRDRLDLGVANWERTGRDAVLRGVLLDEARRRQAERPDDLNDREQSFIEESWRVHQLERRKRVATVTALAVLAAICVIIFHTLWKSREKAAEIRARFVQEVAEIRANPKKEDIPRALRAVQGVKTRETLEALLAAVQVARPPAVEMARNTAIKTVAFSADGQWLAIGTKDGTTDVWDGGASVACRYNYQKSYPPDDVKRDQAAVNKTVLSVAFSKDSSMIAMASANGLLRLWKWQSSEAPLTFGSSGDGVLTRAVFSADGKSLLAASRDGTVKRWDLERPGARPDAIRVGGEVQALAARGAYLATGDTGGHVRLWADSLTEVVELDRHEGPVTDVAFSADSKYLASTGNDGKLQVWEVETRNRLLVQEVDSSGAAGVAFTPDGTQVVTAGLSGRAYVWSARKKGDGLALLGRKSTLRLTSVAFPLQSGKDNSNCVAVAGDDGFVHTYELNFQLLEADAQRLVKSLALDVRSP